MFIAARLPTYNGATSIKMLTAAILLAAIATPALAHTDRHDHGDDQRQKVIVPGNMGDEDWPTDFGKPVKPVPPEEIERPSVPGKMGDED